MDYWGGGERGGGAKGMLAPLSNYWGISQFDKFFLCVYMLF